MRPRVAALLPVRRSLRSRSPEPETHVGSILSCQCHLELIHLPSLDLEASILNGYHSRSVSIRVELFYPTQSFNGRAPMNLAFHSCPFDLTASQVQTQESRSHRMRVILYMSTNTMLWYSYKASIPKTQTLSLLDRASCIRAKVNQGNAMPLHPLLRTPFPSAPCTMRMPATASNPVSLWKPPLPSVAVVGTSGLTHPRTQSNHAQQL